MSGPLSCSFALLLALTASSFADDKAPITDAEVRAFQQRFEDVRKDKERVQKFIAEEEQKAQAKPATIETANKNNQLQYLRNLLLLEKDLVLLSTPASRIPKEVEVPGLTSSENTRIPKLRMDILLGERERIKTALAERSSLHGEERTAKDILRDEDSLDGIYAKAARKLDREIKKLEKELTKEEESSIPDEEEIDELLDELDQLREDKKILFSQIYGHELGGGFDCPFTLPVASAEALRVTLQQEREAALKILRDEEENEGEDGKKGGVVGGSFIYSSNLGVILDVSGSMTQFIEPLKKEIAQNFQSPHYREIKGCKLKEDSLAFTATLGSWGQLTTMAAIEELTVAHQVDTVYWFCDLNDGYTLPSIRYLRYLLHHSGAAFHVKSVGQQPGRELEPLITDFQD